MTIPKEMFERLRSEAATFEPNSSTQAMLLESADAIQYLLEGADEVNQALREQIEENERLKAENDDLQAKIGVHGRDIGIAAVKRLNLNCKVRFRLNDFGKEIYYHRFDEVNDLIKAKGGKPIDGHYPKVDPDGFTEFQLWDFIGIYGAYADMGKPKFWEDFNFYIDNEDLEAYQG